MPPLDTIRHQVPAPISSPATVEDWQAALNNAKAQLEHQRIRYAYFWLGFFMTELVCSS